MVKVLHLIVSVHLGGSEIVAFNLAEHCHLKNPDTIEPIIAELHKTTNNYSIEKKKEISSKKIRLISLSGSSKRLSLLVAPFTLLYYLRKIKPDIIHSHTDLPDFVLSATLRMLSLFGMKAPKIVRTIHNTHLWPTHDSMGKFTETAFEDDIVVGVSHPALQGYQDLRLKNKLSLSAHQSVILNGCVIPSKKDYPFAIDKEKINIAFCGRFEHQKGIDVLIERIKKIKKEYSHQLLFHFVGNGTYLSELQALAKSSNNVILYDSVPNIAEKMHLFDFLIMPSRFEGFGLVFGRIVICKNPRYSSNNARVARNASARLAIIVSAGK